MNIEYDCPNCPNGTFEIQVTLVESTMQASGLYRCECTACGLIQTIKSKSPDNPDRYLLRPSIRINGKGVGRKN